MKKHYTTILLTLFSTTSPLYLLCMNSSSSVAKTTDEKIYTLKTKIPGAHNVAFLSNENVFVVGNKTCSFIRLYPFLSEREISFHTIYGALSHSGQSPIAVNKDQSLCALSKTKKIKVYDTKKGKKLYTVRHGEILPTPIAFDSQNTSQLFYRYGSNLYCAKDKYFENCIDNFNGSSLACHPNKTQLIEYGEKNGDLYHQCYSYKPSKTKYMPSLYIYPEIRIPSYTHNASSINKEVVSAEYNHDGSILIINTRNSGFYIFKENDKSSSTLRTYGNNGKQFFDALQLYSPSMAFHPNNVTLALLTYNNKIQYWNCLTAKKITQTKLDFSKKIVDFIANKRIAISPDGKKILVALNDKCLLLNIPLDAQFPGALNKRTITLYLSLQKYAKNNNIPNDTINLILDTYLELCKH
jgi:hypothetical protein